MRLKIVIHKDKTKYLREFGEIGMPVEKKIYFFCNKLHVRASI